MRYHPLIINITTIQLMKHCIIKAVILMISLLFPANILAQEPYVVFEGNVLTFYYDNNREGRTGRIYDMYQHTAGRSSAYGGYDWYEMRSSILKVVFDPSFSNYHPTDLSYLFYELNELESIEGMEYLNTESVTNLNSMFFCCYQLTDIDFSHFDTRNVTNMSHMLFACSIKELDLRTFSFNNKTDAIATKEMFSCCRLLETIYVSENWGINMSDKILNGWEFYDCKKLVGGCGTVYSSNHIGPKYAIIDEGPTNPGYFTYKEKDTASQDDYDNYTAYAIVTNDSLTFYYDNEANSKTGTKYDVNTSYSGGNDLPGWYADSERIRHTVIDPSLSNYNASSTAYWFYGLSSMEDIKGLQFLKTASVTNMHSMFEGCGNLKEIGVNDFYTKNVTDMSSMFSGCSSLEEIDVSCFNTEQVTDFSLMFNNCTSLADIDVSGFVTNKASSTARMFAYCQALGTLHLTNFNTSNVTNMDRMFVGCTALKTIYVRNTWNTDKLASGAGMFLGCKNLVGGFGTKYDRNHINQEYAHIDGGTSNPGYLTGWKPGQNIGKAYAVLNDGTLTFYYDDYGMQRNGTVYNVNGDKLGVQDWHYDRNRIIKAVFDASFADYYPTSTAFWFYDCKSITSVDSLKYLSTDSVRNMTHMFRFCYALKEADVSHFETSKVTDMSCMFCYCTNLSKIDVSSFNTENVTNMEHMFHTCPVDTLNLRSFNTSKVIDTNTMFADCRKVRTIYARRGLWTNESFEKSDYMFSNCINVVGGCGTVFDYKHTKKEYAIIDEGISNPGYLTDDIGDPEPYAVLKDSILTFYYDGNRNWRKGQTFDVRDDYDYWPDWHDVHLETKTVTFDVSFADYLPLRTDLWFHDFRYLTQIIDIKNLNTSEVIDMNHMFHQCYSIVDLDLSHFITNNVKNMNGLFSWCTEIKKLDLSSFNTEKVEDMSGMFAQCDSIKSIVLTNFNTSNVKRMKSMFSMCAKLKQINMGEGFCTDNVVDMRSMFYQCRSLQSINLQHFRTSKVTKMNSLFFNCLSLTRLDLESFNTHEVTDMSEMFRGCSSVSTLDVSSFDTSKVTNMSSMFSSCSSVSTLDVSSFSTAKVKETTGMFSGCSSLTTIYCSNKWNLQYVEISDYMFDGCDNLVGGCGTLYDAQHIDYTYAHIDGGPENPGYLTYKAKEIPTDIEYVEQGDEKGIWYNMQGIRIKEPTKAGIYMKDGKKIVVK